MIKNKILKGLLLVVLSLATMGGAFASPIGCEYYNSTVIKCWNNGSIENVSFYSVPDGQMWNREDNRQDWMTYEAGAFLTLDNRFPLSFEGADFGYYNDSEHYYLWWGQEYTRTGKTVYINHTRQQGLNDDYVTIYTNITLVNGWHVWSNPIYIYWEMQDIDIWNDGIPDFINTLNYSEPVSINLSWDYDFLMDNISNYYTVGSSEPIGGVKWQLYGEDLGAWFTEPYDTGFYHKITGPFYNGRVISLKYGWIDIDPCLISCNFGCSYNVQDNNSFATLWHPQNEQVDELCRVNVICGIGSGSCTLANCYLTRAINESGTGLNTKFEPMPEQDYNQAWNCVSGDCFYGPIGVVSSGSPLTVQTTRQAVKPGLASLHCDVRDASTDPLVLKDLKKYTGAVLRGVNKTLEQNITLVEPANYFNATLGDTISFNCTRESYWTDYLALSLNDSILYNISSQGFSNLSYDWESNATGIWEWDCKSYTYGNDTAPWSWNGNYTINISEALYTPIKNFIYYWIDRSWFL